MGRLRHERLSDSYALGATLLRGFTARWFASSVFHARMFAAAVLLGTLSTPSAAQQAPLYLGGDISALARIEQAGATFVDSVGSHRSGSRADAISILMDRGANTFRLRLFVEPNYREVQVNDLPYTIALARRIKDAGARFVLDFHYSDTWADPGRQTTPASWAELDFAGLERRVESYSHDVIEALADAGVLPEIVQIGNEINPGILWPLGRLDGDDPEPWDRFARLLKAGIRGVKSGAAPDSVQIMLHHSEGGDSGATHWFFDHIVRRGVEFDLIGMSYYPWWHGSLSDLTSNLHATAQRYNRDIMIVETAYPWREGGWETWGRDEKHTDWPITREGQAAFLKDVVDAVRSVPDGRGIGVLWWYPESIQAPDLYVWGGGSVALFDERGAPLPATLVFQDVQHDGE